MAKKKSHPDNTKLVAELEKRLDMMREIREQLGVEITAAEKILQNLKRETGLPQAKPVGRKSS